MRGTPAAALLGLIIGSLVGTALGFLAGALVPLLLTGGSAAPFAAIFTTPVGLVAGLVARAFYGGTPRKTPSN